ncbi:MAG TPA: translation initiation factor IF-2, partial [Ruminococcus sp.]|nr:translation initiation factor IF-2 [Ruminococcus sp.]
MANMRVHELAKELNISSKDITDMLSSNEKKYTAMSGLGESEINSVKNKFKAKPAANSNTVKQEPKKAEERNVKTEEKKINTDKKEQTKQENVKTSGDKKNTSQEGDKKHISQVYFPQNSQKSDNRDRNNNRKDNNGNSRNNDRNGYGNRDNRDG